MNTLESQPQKIAAVEGVWETEKGAPLLLFAIPDEQSRMNHFEVGIPKVASLILTHKWEGEIQGLNEFVPDHPPVAPLFFSFRIMVGIGFLMLMVSWISSWQIARKGMPNPMMAKILVAMTFSGWVATLAGWYVTEIGRQPYLVSGLLKTADAASGVTTGPLLSTLLFYLLLYICLLVAYISTLFYMAKKASFQQTIATESSDQFNALGGVR